MKPVAPLLALVVAAPSGAAETLAVVSVADPPGPGVELAEMTHQLRAACRDRAGGVLEAPEMRARLLGQLSGVTLAELDRAYGGALATYQNGEYESSIRTLYAIVDDLEKMPETAEAYSQWIRALLRLAHAEATIGHTKEARDAMERVLAVEPRYQPDPEQYSPAYRRDFDAARVRVAAKPRRKLSVAALGGPGAVFVNGRDVGAPPVALALPAGRYRVGGAASGSRVPSMIVELQEEDRSVVLDFALAESLRVNAGPGLALPRAARPTGVVRAGAWLAVDKVLATSLGVENDVPFLVGTLYDIRRGAVQREGRVRMTAGAVPSVNLGALAAFLLTGQPSREVLESRPAPLPVAAFAAGAASATAAPPGAAAPEPTSAIVAQPAPKGWMRPAAYAAGGLSLVLAGYAVTQGLSASGAYGDANAMLRPDGVLKPGADPGAYHDAVARGDAASRRAYIAAGAAVLSAAATGLLWVLSREPQAPGAVAFRF